MFKTLISITLAVALLGAGAWYAFSGGEAKSNAYGGGTGATVTAIGDILRDPNAFLGAEVTVEGELTKECPGSGCWWYVKDRTGEIRADSLGGGFALPLHQEGKTIRTTGKVVRMESGELQLAASGAALR